MFELTEITDLYVNSTRPINVFALITRAGVTSPQTNFCGYLEEAMPPPVSQLGLVHTSYRRWYAARQEPGTSYGSWRRTPVRTSRGDRTVR